MKTENEMQLRCASQSGGCFLSILPIVQFATQVNSKYRRIPQAGPFTWRAVTKKTETQNQKEDQISIRTTPDNAEFEVFSDSRRFFS